MLRSMANETARKLRSAMTRQEIKLWLQLRELRKLGFHFRRQVPVKGFIVDFACYHPRVIVEVDASQHSTSTMSGEMPHGTQPSRLTDSGSSAYGTTTWT